MIKDFGNQKLPRFRAGEPLVEQLTAERMNDICAMIEACRLQNGVGYMMNRSQGGTTLAILDNAYTRPPRLWKVSLGQMAFDPVTLVFRVVNVLSAEIVAAVSNPQPMYNLIKKYFNQFIDIITNPDFDGDGNFSVNDISAQLDAIVNRVIDPIINSVDGKVEQVCGAMAPIASALGAYFTERGNPQNGDMIYTDELGICYTIYQVKSETDGGVFYPTGNLIFRVIFSVGECQYCAMTTFPMPDIAECVKTMIRSIVNWIKSFLSTSIQGIINSIIQTLLDIWSKVGMIKEGLDDALSAAESALDTAISDVSDIANNALTNALGALSGLSKANSDITNTNTALDKTKSDTDTLKERMDKNDEDMKTLQDKQKELDDKQKADDERHQDEDAKKATVSVLGSTGDIHSITVFEDSSQSGFEWKDVGFIKKNGTGVTIKMLTENNNGNLNENGNPQPTQVAVCENGTSSTKTFIEIRQ